MGLQRAMETPYVVRSHAASQTHSEQECWKFAHFRRSKSMDADAQQQNLSADAAKNVSSDRHAHLSFQFDATGGAAMGCGYGAFNPEMAFMATASTGEVNGPNSDSTSLIIHGLLGTFHSVLYQSKDKTKLSTISIAPNSFSVGMFSWFPLVSDKCGKHTQFNISFLSTFLCVSSFR